jgi:hypothetical protein
MQLHCHVAATILAIGRVVKANASQAVCPSRDPDSSLFGFSEQGRFFFRDVTAF